MAIKREARFTEQFRHWLKANPMPSSAFELKYSPLSAIPFSSVKDHQLAALMAVETASGLLYKAPDDSRGVKPFDLFYLAKSAGYVVIKYPGQFSLIRAYRFLQESASSTRRSLTKERAAEIAELTVKI